MMAVFVWYSQMKPISICVLHCEDLARHSFYLDLYFLRKKKKPRMSNDCSSFPCGS